MPATSTPIINIQGNPVNGNQIDPPTFFKYTRRQRGLMAGKITSWAGFGEPDILELKPTGILAAIDIHFSGSLTITLGTGTAASTAKWPYGLLRMCKLTANGQSNLIMANGLFLKARELISNPGLDDRGVSQTIAGATVNQGTLSLNEESWGVGQNSTLTSGTYDVELSYRVPVAWDLVKLFGSLYLQTAATSVILENDWCNLSDVFTLTGNATATMTGAWTAQGVVFTIPSVGGVGVIPDLSVFHSVTQNNTNQVALGQNNPVLAGQGTGKQLMRIFGNVWSGSTGPGAPLAMTSANFGQLSWGYGLNDTPEVWNSGFDMAADVERSYSSDMGKYQGLFVMDFAKHWGFRDSVDEAAATQLNVGIDLQNAPTNGRLEYCQEVMIGASS